MPYIVIIIDEFGDLIMTAGKKWNCLLSNRAIGTCSRYSCHHATQRPTTNIITGTIKANFPAVSPSVWLP